MTIEEMIDDAREEIGDICFSRSLYENEGDQVGRLLRAFAREILELSAEAALDAYVPCVPYMGDDGRGALKNAAEEIRALMPPAEGKS